MHCMLLLLLLLLQKKIDRCFPAFGIRNVTRSLAALSTCLDVHSYPLAMAKVLTIQELHLLGIYPNRGNPLSIIHELITEPWLYTSSLFPTVHCIQYIYTIFFNLL